MKTATQEIRHAKAIISTIKDLYNKSGWNAVHGYLRAAKIAHKLETIEFGLSTNSATQPEKEAWIKSTPKNQFRAHLYNRGLKSNGYHYNIVRGQQITLL